MYLSALCFTCELVMALTIMWKFLIKQKKYKTWLLLYMYILTIGLAVMRIYDSIFFLFTHIEFDLYGW